MRLDHNQFGNFRHATEHEGSRSGRQSGLLELSPEGAGGKRGGVDVDIELRWVGYQAGSWSKPRRAIAKVEWHPGELYPRVGFIVTNMSRPAKNVVAFYNKRGTCEQWREVQVKSLVAHERMALLAVHAGSPVATREDLCNRVKLQRDAAEATLSRSLLGSIFRSDKA
jgi:Transposase DDE domain group 1